MDDTGFLRDLARTAREEEAEEHQRWDRWDRLTDGALSPEEEAELKALAATSAEAEMAFEAFLPLDEDFRARMAEEIGQLVPEPPRVFPKAVNPRFWEKLLRAVREGFTFSWRQMRFVGPVLAAAAASLYIFIPPPPIPKFTIAHLESRVEIWRGGEVAGVLLAGMDFSASAIPSAKLSKRKKVESRCYVQSIVPDRRKFRVAKCDVVERNSRTGAPKIGGHLPADIPIGPATLWIVLAYPGDQPAPNLIAALLTNTPTRMRNWTAEPTLIEVRAP